jgi:simple sugar transport system ATP-binding protein
MTNIVKTFPGGVTANDHIDFSVREGDIHALLGENGAGKSTLMKILYGIYTRDGGEIRLRGKRVDIDSPRTALGLGIGMVHQHFKLVGRLSVAENIRLGGAGRRRAGDEGGETHSLLERLRDRLTATGSGGAEREQIRALVEEYGIDIDLDATVWELDVGVQQRVEILKALYNDVDLLILDEPTATLPEQEKDQLFETLRRLRDGGTTIILITHKLREVGEIADRTTVLRDGRVVDTVPVETVDRNRLAEMMVGREVLFDIHREEPAVADVALSVEGLTALDDRGFRALDGVDFELSSGEIVGLAGISGNGQEQLAECLAGLRETTGGSIRIHGTEMADAPPQRFALAGLNYIPADRYEYGVAPEMSLMHNAILKNHRTFSQGGSMDYDAATAYAEELIEEFDITASSARMSTNTLSGGNLQKLIVGRELSQNPDILIAHHPTRGVDVGSMEYIREVLLDQTDEGTGVFLISDDLDEVMQMSDRVLVIYEGRIVHRTTRAEADRQRIGRYMTQGDRREGEDATAPVGDVA